MAKESVQAECSVCGGRRECKVLRQEIESWSEEGGKYWGSSTYQIIRCCGCKKISFREVAVFSEEYDDEGDYIKREKYYPKIERVKFTPKVGEPFEYFWYSPIDVLRREIYMAINNDTPCLAAMGIRSLIETIGRELLKEKELPFGQQIDKLVDCGWISTKQKEILGVVLEFGHSAVHRGHVPEIEEVQTALDIIESIINLVIVNKEKAEKLDKATPKRQPKVKAAKSTPSN